MTTIAFYKPYNVVCQFSGEGRTLAEFNLPPEVYAAGRLDKDSEGLLILTDDGKLNQKITHPKFEKSKVYHVQVEGVPEPAALKKLSRGVLIKDYITLPCQVERLENVSYPEREPPIRHRAHIPTTWLSLTLQEGKNRQVRRMTAAIGHPTLRLIRAKIGEISIQGLKPGEWLEIAPNSIFKQN